MNTPSRKVECRLFLARKKIRICFVWKNTKIMPHCLSSKPKRILNLTNSLLYFIFLKINIHIWQSEKYPRKKRSNTKQSILLMQLGLDKLGVMSNEGMKGQEHRLPEEPFELFIIACLR